MITIIITSYKEPKSTVRAVNAFLNQKIKEKFKITVVDPFPEVENHIKKEIKDKRVEFFLDPGEGKSYALNLLLEQVYSKNKEDILVFTDGDVFVSDNALEEILIAFKDKQIGCVTGKPVSLDERNTKYGYWSHLLFSGIDRVRKRLSDEKKFFECSGYLFAIRNGIITDFPLDASEDSIIPYLFWKKDYKIAYVEKAEVYVKNPSTWKDWLAQKVRNIKGHENLDKIAPDMPRTKSFLNEIKHGALFTLTFSRNLKEFFWTIELYFARLYLYIKAFKEIKTKKQYSDGWRETEIQSTKTLD
jgi:cellulose synthase/poly-beta-1,6-N-acetylglucosamine synthase-like glycosyltransferase